MPKGRQRKPEWIVGGGPDGCGGAEVRAGPEEERQPGSGQSLDAALKEAPCRGGWGGEGNGLEEEGYACTS